MTHSTPHNEVMSFYTTFSKDRINLSVPCVVICPGHHGHAVARSLGTLGISVYGVHGDVRSPSAKSRHWRKSFFWNLSMASEEKSVEWFLLLARNIGSRPILLPTDDCSILFLDNNADKLQQEYLFPKLSTGLVRTLCNKKHLYFLCKKNSVQTPDCTFPKCRNDVLQFIEQNSFPVLLKGIETTALQRRVGLRMLVVKDATTLLNFYDMMEGEGFSSLMLQEYIPGDDENVWMFNGYFDNNSNCLFGLTGRKLRQYPPYTGMTCLGISEMNDTLYKQANDFLKSIEYRGIVDIDFKYDTRTGKFYLLDPNPRLGVAFRLFVDNNGMDVVRALYLDMTGQPLKIGVPVEGRKWIAEPFDISSSWKYWRDKKFRLIDWLRSFKGVEEAQWFSCHDMAPFFMVWLRSLQLIFEKLMHHKTSRKVNKSIIL